MQGSQAGCALPCVTSAQPSSVGAPHTPSTTTRRAPLHPARLGTHSLQGTLDSAGCQVLARLCFYVFTPALTAGKLAQAISVESVKSFWPLLANMTLRCAAPRMAGRVCIKITAFCVCPLWQGLY